MQCGFCSMVSDLFRRCFKNRRSSTESYYKELGDQDTLKIEDKLSDSEDSHGNVGSVCEMETHPEVEAAGSHAPAPAPAFKPLTGAFMTLHRRRKKRLFTRSLSRERALLDDMLSNTLQCVLNQSVLWKFNAFALDNISGGRSLPVLCAHLFKTYGLITELKLEPVRLWKLLTLVEEGYHGTNPYHNHVHAADVTQAMHCFLQQRQISEHMQPMEIMASLIAAIAHDVDHPGVNQPFLIATSNHLASLYKNTSVLENHHWRWGLSCLAESGITDHIPDSIDVLEKQISSLILATDITRQREFLTSFKNHLDNNTLDLRKADHRHLVLQIALKCADISNPCRPWEVSRKWSLKVCEEFFRQGDYERKLNLPVTELCDRFSTSIPKIQTGFFQFVVTPLMTQWHRFLQNDLSEQMLDNLNYNKRMWEELLTKELAEETRTEISDADAVEDDLESFTFSNISGSSELLIPPRRCSLNVVKPPHFDRRLSVPLNMLQEAKKEKSSRKSSIANCKVCEAERSLSESEQSLHSQLSLGRSKDNAEKVLSTEKLLPDSSIATITTPCQANRINLVLGKNSKLCRQQTFPPIEARSNVRNYSHDCGSTFKTELGQNVTKYGMSIFSKLFARNEPDKTDDNASDISESTYSKICDVGTQGERRESAPAPVGLDANRSSLPCAITKEELLHRRQSMPTDVGQFTAPKEKKGCDAWGLPLLLGRTVSAREHGNRRGSAPVDVREIKALVGSAIRHSLNGAGKMKKDLQPISACHQWIVKTTYNLQEKQKAAFQRRGSLPVEVLKDGTYY